jgi:hypothetical protein
MNNNNLLQFQERNINKLTIGAKKDYVFKMTMKRSKMTSDERDIHGQDRQEIEVEGCNTQFW